MEKKIIEKFGNRLRIRVCGILEEDDNILLVKHSSIGREGILWAPPGGGMKFGTNAEENLIREFKEETGLDIAVMDFLFVHEFLSPPLHAMEFFFKVKKVGGSLMLGHDPEMSQENQIIREIRFVSKQEIVSMDPETVHNALLQILNFQPIDKCPRYSKFEHYQ